MNAIKVRLVVDAGAAMVAGKVRSGVVEREVTEALLGRLGAAGVDELARCVSGGVVDLTRLVSASGSGQSLAGGLPNVPDDSDESVATLIAARLALLAADEAAECVATEQLRAELEEVVAGRRGDIPYAASWRGLDALLGRAKRLSAERQVRAWLAAPKGEAPSCDLLTAADPLRAEVAAARAAREAAEVAAVGAARAARAALEVAVLSAEQRTRHSAGVLPDDELLDAAYAQVYAPLSEAARSDTDPVAARECDGKECDVGVIRSDASTLSASQCAALRRIAALAAGLPGVEVQARQAHCSCADDGHPIGPRIVYLRVRCQWAGRTLTRSYAAE